MPEAQKRLVFRSVAGWVWLALVAALAIFLLGDVVVRSGWFDAVLMAPWFLLIAWIVWVFQVSPRIVADEQGVTLVNILRVVRLPWSAVRAVRLRYQAEFELRDGGRVAAWGGAGRRLHLSLKRGGADPAEEQVSDLEQLHAAAESSDAAAVERSWNVPAVVAFVVIVAWAIWALVETGGPVLPGA